MGRVEPRALDASSLRYRDFAKGIQNVLRYLKVQKLDPTTVVHDWIGWRSIYVSDSDDNTVEFVSYDAERSEIRRRRTSLYLERGGGQSPGPLTAPLPQRGGERGLPPRCFPGEWELAFPRFLGRGTGPAVSPSRGERPGEGRGGLAAAVGASAALHRARSSGSASGAGVARSFPATLNQAPPATEAKLPRP